MYAIHAHLVRHVIELTKSNDDFHMWHVQIRDACVMWTTLKTHVTDFSNVNINTFSACSVTANHGFSSLNVSTNTSWHRVQFSASNVYNTLYLNCRDIAKEPQGINCSLKKCQLPQKCTDIFCRSRCFLLVISRDNVNCTLSTHYSGPIPTQGRQKVVKRGGTEGKHQRREDRGTNGAEWGGVGSPPQPTMTSLGSVMSSPSRVWAGNAFRTYFWVFLKETGRITYFWLIEHIWQSEKCEKN